MSRFPPSSRFHSGFTDSQDNPSSSDQPVPSIPPPRLSRRSKARLNPTASTSSSTLVNEQQDCPPIDQELPPKPFDPFDFHSTRHLTVCEEPVGAQPNRHASNSQLVHSSEQLSKILYQESRIQYHKPPQTNSSLANHHSSLHLHSNPTPASELPPQDSSTPSFIPPSNSSNIIRETQSEQPPPPLPRRKPRSSLKDQQLLQKLTNSPHKLNLNRTATKNINQVHPQVESAHSQSESTDPVTSKSTIQPENLVPEKFDTQAKTMSNNDVISAHQVVSSDEEHDTDSLEISPGQKLHDMYHRALTAPISALLSEKNTLDKAQSNQSQIGKLPAGDPKPKLRPPLEHLRGKMDVSNNSSQPTRPVTSDVTKESKILNDHPNQASEPTGIIASNHSSHPHSQSHPPKDPLKADNQNLNSNTKPVDDTHSHHMPKKPGWPSYPLITPKATKSDNDSPEDFVKSNQPVPQPIDSKSGKADAINGINQKPTMRNFLDTPKPVTRNLPESQKKVTFSTMASDDERGNVAKNISRNLLPSSTSHSENLNHVSTSASQNRLSREDTQNSTILDSCSMFGSGQTTLATPRITGYYPSTPSEQHAPSSRLVSSETATRRIEKIKNQPPHHRNKRLRSGLENQSNQGLPEAQPQGRPSQSLVFRPYTSPNPKYIPLSRSRRNAPISSMKGKEKEIPASNTDLRDANPNEQDFNAVSSLATPAAKRNHAETYDETVMNPELTRASCFPTPHPPGWLGFGPPSQTNESFGFDPSQAKSIPPTSAMTQDVQKNFSSCNNGHVIYASNPPRPPSSQSQPYRTALHSNSQPGEFMPANRIRPTGSNLQHDGANELTPRPTRQSSQQNQSINTEKQAIESRVMNTPKLTHQPNAFSSPSFEGFNDDDKIHLTSTPAPPRPQNQPPAPSGPMKTVKDLTSAVIEFLVEKNPIESLADVISPANQNQLSKKKPLNAQYEGNSNQNQLIELLKSSEKVEKDRLLIQSKLDQINLENKLSSRIYKFFYNILFKKKYKNNNNQTRFKPQSHTDCFKLNWKFIWLGLVFQLLFIWLTFNLAAIRTYNSLMQINSFQSSSASLIISTNYYGHYGWNKRSRFPSFMMKTHPRDDHLPEHNNNTSNVHIKASNYNQLDTEDHNFFDGLFELLHFSFDWFCGFKFFFRHQSNIILGFGQLDNLQLNHSSSASSSRSKNKALNYYYYFKSFFLGTDVNTSSVHPNDNDNDNHIKFLGFNSYNEALVDFDLPISVPT